MRSSQESLFLGKEYLTLAHSLYSSSLWTLAPARAAALWSFIVSRGAGVLMVDCSVVNETVLLDSGSRPLSLVVLKRDSH